MCCLSFTVSGLLLVWFNLKVEVLSGSVDSHVHLFVADVIKSFDTVDRGCS